MKQNVNPVKVIIEKDRIKIVNSLFDVKSKALDKEHADLLKRSLPYALFSQNFQSSCSSELLCIAGFERLRNKTFLSQTKEAS